jgi:hypothetical protein
MTGASDDFFDFPDEEWTEETGVLPGPRRRPLRIPVRLATLVAGVLLLTILITVAVNGCGGPSAAAQTKRYVEGLDGVATDSHQLGSQFATSLSATRTASALATTVNTLAGRAAEHLANARQLAPPPSAPLQRAQTYATQALALRVAGLEGIANTLRRPRAPRAGAALLGFLQQLVASDVIWHDRVETVIAAELARARITSLTAPPSVFLANPNLATPTAVSGLLQGSASTRREPVLRLGDHGFAVKNWQLLLHRWLGKNHHAGTPLTPDGSFGSATAALTRTFQTSAGLTPDGLVGPATRRAMSAALMRG